MNAPWVLFDNANAKMTVTSIQDGTYYVDLYYTLESKKEGVPLNLWNVTASVDGYLISCYESTDDNDVPVLRLDVDDMLDAGITSIDEITFWIDIRDSEYAKIFDGSATIAPTGKKAEDRQRPAVKTGAINATLLDNEQLTLILMDAEADDWGWGTDFSLYLRNKSGKLISVSLEEGVANGKSVEIFFGMQLPAGAQSYSSFSLDSEEFTGPLTALKVKINIIDPSTYETVFSQTVNYTAAPAATPEG